MTSPCHCPSCPAFGPFCDGCTGCSYRHCASDCAACPVRCARRHDPSGRASGRSLDAHLAAIGGLALNVPLSPQPRVSLPSFFPQLLNGLEVTPMISREAAVGVGVDKVLTAAGQVSRRALPHPYNTYSLRVQWGIAESSLLVCLGNALDTKLERLWAAQARGENIWGHIATLGFNAATSLNFSIYLDQPRMEHLINLKRTWLTIRRMQATSRLIPIPHLQWAHPLDLGRQLDYVQAQGFHTLTFNLQLTKRQGWDVIAAGVPLLRERAPGLHFWVAGAASLKRMAEVAALLPGASFTNTTAHYLAQRHVRLQRDGVRLIKEPVDGHPDIILAHNVRLYRDFLAELRGEVPRPQPQPPPSPFTEVVATLQTRFGFTPEQAYSTYDHLSADETVLVAFQTWLHTGELDRNFRGSFPTWPCADCVPHLTLAELLDAGFEPLDAFLHLGGLAHRVDEEIQVFVGQAGY